jgi:hypothetical protein
MNEVFRQHVEALHPKFEMLMAMEPVTFAELSKAPAKPGIYLLSEPAEHLYIGRGKSIRARLKNHLSGPSGASFAVKLARERINRPTTYTPKDSLGQLLTEPEFVAAFSNVQNRIRGMSIRFVEEPDCNRQALLEIYATLALNTRYNDFDTH